MRKESQGGSVKRFRPRPRVPILITENAEEFNEFLDQIERDIKPRGPLERMLVERIAQEWWEIRRYDRCKSAIMNAAYGPALRDLLNQAGVDSEEGAELADRWFTESAAKIEVNEKLRRVGLDESAIQAEVIRRSLTELEALEKMIGWLEARARTALASMDQYRDVVIQLRGRSEPVIEGKLVQLPRK
jgi:hypothetical protein